MSAQYIPASVSLQDAQRAFDTWGANCGPGALAATLDLTLDDVYPHVEGFDRKRYTNPLMMYGALRSLGVRWTRIYSGWLQNGLVRVQWEGPWTRPGVPQRARYRHTHWIACRQIDGRYMIFDINCACVGWVSLDEWSDQVVPWLLRQVEPKSDGGWYPTHRLEVIRCV